MKRTVFNLLPNGQIFPARPTIEQIKRELRAKLIQIRRKKQIKRYRQKRFLRLNFARKH